MNESFSSLVDSATSILVLLPSDPQFDHVAAGLSLYMSLQGKKPVSVYSPTPMLAGYNRLMAIDKVGQKLGDRNLTITFSNYDAGNIEKVSYDIENGEFKLSVVPKAGFSAPQKDQIKIDHAGVSADLVIMIGGESEGNFPALGDKNLEGARLVHVGTKALSSDRGVMSFAAPASSISELVTKLIKENGLELNPEVATNLVMGMEEGSNHFESGDVTAETFEVFAHLLRSGGQRLPREKLEPKDFPPGAIPQVPFNQPIEQVEKKEQSTTAVIGEENPPQDWLQPKIYKGTSIS